MVRALPDWWPEALEDRSSKPRQVWNRIPEAIRGRLVELALDEPELSPRELATRFTDTENYFVSEASVYRLLKAPDLITSPAFILMKAADRFTNPTTAANQLWQTDFTYLKVIGWGWFYLSTVLDDFSRYILAWKLCTTMSAADVSDTLQVALQASGLNQVRLMQRPRLSRPNNTTGLAGAEWLAFAVVTTLPESKGTRYGPGVDKCGWFGQAGCESQPIAGQNRRND